VEAYGRGLDLKVVEELLGLAGVFAGDAVGLTEDAQGAQGDVFKVADGCADEVEAGSQFAFKILGGFGMGFAHFLSG